MNNCINVQEAFNSIYKFNDIAGKFNNVKPEDIDLQLSLQFEELTESITAFEEENVNELLDGAIDTFVIASGMLQLLQAAGFKVDEALNKVVENNLSKYPAKFDVKDLPVGWNVDYNNDYKVFVIKDGNGKIRKPPYFIPVDLFGLSVYNFFS